MSRRILCLASLAVSLFGSGRLLADEPPPVPVAPPAAPAAPPPAAAPAVAPTPRAATEAELATIERLIDELGSDSWAAREAAQTRLSSDESLPHASVIEICLGRVKSTADPEIRARARAVLKEQVGRHIFTYPSKGFIGVQLARRGAAREIDGEIYSPISIERILPGTAAETHELQVGQQVIQIDDHKCQSGFGLTQFIEYVAGYKPGHVVRLKLIFGKETIERDLTLGERPPNPPLGYQKAEFFERWLRDQLESEAETPAAAQGEAPAATE